METQHTGGQLQPCCPAIAQTSWSSLDTMPIDHPAPTTRSQHNWFDLLSGDRLHRPRPGCQCQRPRPLAGDWRSQTLHWHRQHHNQWSRKESWRWTPQQLPARVTLSVSVFFMWHPMEPVEPLPSGQSLGLQLWHPIWIRPSFKLVKLVLNLPTYWAKNLQTEQFAVKQFAAKHSENPLSLPTDHDVDYSMCCILKPAWIWLCKSELILELVLLKPDPLTREASQYCPVPKNKWIADVEDFCRYLCFLCLFAIHAVKMDLWGKKKVGPKAAFGRAWFFDAPSYTLLLVCLFFVGTNFAMISCNSFKQPSGFLGFMGWFEDADTVLDAYNARNMTCLWAVFGFLAAGPVFLGLGQVCLFVATSWHCQEHVHQGLNATFMKKTWQATPNTI